MVKAWPASMSRPDLQTENLKLSATNWVCLLTAELLVCFIFFLGMAFFSWFCFVPFFLLHRTFEKFGFHTEFSNLNWLFSLLGGCIWVFLCEKAWVLPLFHQLYIERHWVMFISMYSSSQFNSRGALFMCSVWKPWGTSHTGLVWSTFGLVAVFGKLCFLSPLKIPSCFQVHCI